MRLSSLLRRRSGAAFADAAIAQPVTGPSSIEYRESHRGFLLRVSANSLGLYALCIEDPQGSEACGLTRLPDIDRRFPADGFADLTEAIAAVATAKIVIDDCLSRKRA
ncbi:hypothetical protein [Caballeronia insecticola]|uniref:hypothetical protein n=1 Tax=Caballeronia insecticola TaxID=758793 RepID=UPI0003A79898|nr:hypothetical protein [Caballeronia insecticola]